MRYQKNKTCVFGKEKQLKVYCEDQQQLCCSNKTDVRKNYNIQITNVWDPFIKSQFKSFVLFYYSPPK